MGFIFAPGILHSITKIPFVFFLAQRLLAKEMSWVLVPVLEKRCISRVKNSKG
jgi:hypothetical protein